ncbi:hypothetical protein D3C79_145510 [compost metagenome]
MAVIAAGNVAQRFPRLDRHLPVGFRRQRQNHLGGVDRAFNLRPAHRRAFGFHVIELFQEIDFGLGIPGDAFAAVAQLVQQRPQRGKTLVGGRVVTLHHQDVRRGFTGDQLAFALLPVFHAIRLRQLCRGIVLDRQRHHVGFLAQMPYAHLGEGFGDALVDLPVALGIPGRIDRRRQRVNERMHVRGIHVVFFVPGGSRQHDVRVKAGAGHAEIERHHQIQLAFTAVIPPFHFLRLGSALLAQILALNAVFSAQQVFEHVLMALAGGAQEVGTPDEQVTREVLRVVRLLGGEAKPPRLQRVDGEIYRRLPGGFRLRRQMQRVNAQLWRGRQPPHAFGTHVEIDQAAAKARLVRQRRQQLFGCDGFIPPLAGVVVEERGAVHMARRTLPVEPERQRQPTGLRPQFFLADIVCPAAAALADATAEDQHVDQAAVGHVHVVPVVDAGTDDNH